jgi:hypothetical protein
MRKILISLLILMSTVLFSQEITVITEDITDEKTTIIFTTTDGSHVPVTRFAGTDKFSDASTDYTVYKFEKLFDAPATIEIDPGFYELNLYEGMAPFEIDAQGGTQEWKIKPKGELLPLGNGLFYVGLSLSIGAAWGFMEDGYNSDIENTNTNYGPILSVAAGVTLVTSIITFITNSPSAERVR